MPSQDEISEQEQLLTVYRRNLLLHLWQQAQMGGSVYALTGTINSIRDDRNNIHRIKKNLRDWGIEVIDHPDDEESSPWQQNTQAESQIKQECIEGVILPRWRRFKHASLIRSRWILFYIFILIILLITISLNNFPSRQISTSVTPAIMTTAGIISQDKFTTITPTITVYSITPVLRENIDRELLISWQNSKYIDNNESVDVEVLERTDRYIILITTASSDINSTTPWQISGKRKCLEQLAVYVSSLYQDSNTTEYMFVRGSIQDANFNETTKSVTIRFKMNLYRSKT